jgi:signal transduction histidine kinase
MNLSISVKRSILLVAANFVMCLVLLLTLGLIVYRHLNSLESYNQKAVRAYVVIHEINYAESLLKDAESGTRAFLITHDSVFLQPLLSNNRLLMPALDSLKKLIKDNPLQLKYYHQVQTLAAEQSQLSDSLITLSFDTTLRKDSLMNALALRGKILMSNYEAASTHVADIESDKLIYRKKQISYYQGKLVNNFTLLFIGVLIIITALGIWIFIEFKKRILYQTSLEENIIRLNQNNTELEQIAFAASHDLQEPVRKIRIFSDRLRMITKNKLDSDSMRTIDIINNSAVRLNGLISDLSDLTHIVQTQKTTSLVSLKEVLELVEARFHDEIQACNCKIIKSEMPVVQGNEEQLQQLFTNLFSNSLAFQAKKRSLVIIISSQKIKSNTIVSLPQQSSQKEYYGVKFQDNGVGFNVSFKEKLFMPFQRLHNYGSDEIRRKGMGLAICKRVMVNHGGWIDGDGIEDNGATIHLYFPVIS